MIFKPKIWLSAGAVALAGTVTTQPKAFAEVATDHRGDSSAESKPSRTLAQYRSREGGESGERGHAREGRGGARARHQAHPKKGPRKLNYQKAPSKAHYLGENAPYTQNSGGERGEQRRALPKGPGGEGGEGGEAGVNTRYIFGFTEGADTERRGEREFENDAIGRFGKRSGTYVAIENETELEFGITDRLLAEIGAFAAYKDIHNVPDLNDRSSLTFDGLTTELKYQVFNHISNGVGLAFSVEPEWHRSSEISGDREDRYSLELKTYIDGEMLLQRLYWAVNLGYEPEIVRTNEGVTERESEFTISGAVTARVMPNLFIGGEIRYISTYDGLALNRLEGDALFLGPTISVRPISNIILQIAYSHQLVGKAIDQSGSLDLTNFEREQVRFRFVAEF
jgi:hypothetical protein